MARTQRRVAAVLAGWLLGGMAIAQAAAAPAPAAHGSPEGEGALAPVAADGPASRDVERARDHYSRALELHDAGAYAKALSEFRRAYALRPSYELLFNIGQLEFRLRRYDKARQSLERYLEQGGSRVDAGRRERVALQIEALRARTDTFVARVDPARAKVEAKGDSVIRSAEPRPAVSRAATAGWLTTGALGLVAIGSGVATLLTSERYEELRHRPAAPGSEASARRRLDEQRDLVSGLSTATDVLAVTAAAAAALSLYFTVSAAAPEEATDRVVSFEVRPDGVRLAGRF